MSEAERFGLDTNVLVYAVDSRDAARHRRAQLVIERARLRFCLLTVQSLGEFYAVTTRKGLLTRQEAAAILRGWMAMFPVVAADAEAAETALAAAEAGRFSYWDALLLATLARHGCTAVLSEDMADGAELAGITVRDPFAGAALPPAVGRLLGA